MDTEIDFLRADLLFQILIADRTLVVEPFTLSAKITPLRQIIEVFYQVNEFDPQLLNDVDYASLMFEGVEAINLESIDIKHMAFIAGATEDLLKIAVKHCGVKAIILKKTATDPSLFTSLVFYQKKTGEIFNGSALDPEMIAWCQEIIDQIKSTSLETVIKELTRIRQGIENLFKVTMEFSTNRYLALMTEYSAREQQVIRKMCENMYLIDLTSIAPESLGHEMSDETPISLQNRDQDDGGEFDVNSDEINSSDQELFQLAANLPEELEPSQNIAIIPQNEKSIHEYQEFQENSPEYITSFEIALDTMRNQYHLQTTTPEMTYISLRSQEWKKIIPSHFFNVIFRAYIIDLVSRSKPGNIAEVIKKEGQKFQDACEGFPGIPSPFVTPALIQELESDPKIAPKLQQHNVAVLPVSPTKKKIIPKVFPFNPASRSPIHEDGQKSHFLPNENRIPVNKTQFTSQYSINCKDLADLPKNERMSYLIAKLQALKQKYIQ